MLLQLLQHLSNSFYVLFAFAFVIDKDVIKVHYHNNVGLLCQDLIDVALESGRYVGQSKKHHLVLKMAVAGPEGCLLFIAFSDPHLIMSIGQIELSKTSSQTSSIQ